MSFITPIEEATQAGFELSMVDNSLSLTPEERGKQHDQALTPVLELDRIRRDRDARIDPTARATG